MALAMALAVVVAARASRADEGADAKDKGAATVVLDAGHGGSNLGSVGASGQPEKILTLRLARAVARRLSTAGVAVKLTREHDEYVTLGERVRRANASGAKVFVSLHVHAQPDKRRRGVETVVASRELVDVAAGRAGAKGDPDAVVARARVRARAVSSLKLAGAIESRVAKARARDRGVRQAPYDVLDGLDMPGAVVEVTYLDGLDGRAARDAAIEGLADAVANGVLDFLAATPPDAQ